MDLHRRSLTEMRVHSGKRCAAARDRRVARSSFLLIQPEKGDERFHVQLRHVDYRVTIKRSTTVGNALLFTLTTGLGAEFTAETRDAWIAAYQVVADTMRAHAYPEFAPRRIAAA